MNEYQKQKIGNGWPEMANQKDKDEKTEMDGRCQKLMASDGRSEMSSQ
jgi:hypothetical protein